jgi:hypothetical protein
MKNIVTSLETSKRLKELGVEQGESFFLIHRPQGIKLRSDFLYEPDLDYYVAAFTAEELGELLGEKVEKADVHVMQEKIVCIAYPLNSADNRNPVRSRADTMAEALGLLLVKVLEEK